MLSLLYFIRGIVMIGRVGASPIKIICTLIFACKSYCTNDFWEKLQLAITSWKVVICTHPIRFWIAPLRMAARKRIVTLIFPCQLEERKTWVRTFVKIHKCTSTLLFQHSGLSVLESIKSQQFITLIAPKTLSVSDFLEHRSSCTIHTMLIMLFSIKWHNYFFIQPWFQLTQMIWNVC